MNRFWRQVKKTRTCWLWQGYTDKDGYGRTWHNGKPERVHRKAYMLLVGDIPNGNVLDHTCRVRNCVNPDHLEPVENAINVMRGWRLTRTHCPNSHEFTPENTRLERQGWKRCRKCLAINQKKYRSK